jgi:hypothetical protein
VEREFLQLPFWNEFTASEAELMGRTLARQLSAPWAFDGVEVHQCGDQRRHVAFFRWEDARFALIPGGDVTLGYDRTATFVPSPGQRESWAGTEEEYGTKLHPYLDHYLTALRRVTLLPFLFETHVREVAPTDLGPFRLPTFDEWEYACGGGARTLFRWSNDCPTDRYPLEEPRFLSRLRDPHWDLHLRPNAFGVRIASNPYETEYCLKPGEGGGRVVARGGDGGGTICGGVGFFAGWIPLATAYYDIDLNGEGEYGQAGATDFDDRCRRALTLPPGCLE